MGQNIQQPAVSTGAVYNPLPAGKAGAPAQLSATFRQFSVAEDTQPVRVSGQGDHHLCSKAELKAMCNFQLQVVEPDEKAMINPPPAMSGPTDADFFMDDLVKQADQDRENMGLLTSDEYDEVFDVDHEVTMIDFVDEEDEETETNTLSETITPTVTESVPTPPPPKEKVPQLTSPLREPQEEQILLEATKHSVLFYDQIDDRLDGAHSDNLADTLEALEELLEEQTTLTGFQARLGEIYQDVDALKSGARELHKHDEALYHAAFSFFDQAATKMISFDLEKAIVNNMLNKCTTAKQFEAELEAVMTSQDKLQAQVALELCEQSPEKNKTADDLTTPASIDAANWWGMNKAKPISELSSAVKSQLADIMEDADLLFDDMKKSTTRKK